MIGDAAGYQELVALYRGYGDEELIALSRNSSDLTEMAQEVLRSELARRGLKIAAVEKKRETLVLTDDDLADMRSYAELAPEECIFDFESEREASAAYYALTGQGIEAIVVSQNKAKFDNCGPRVVVKPMDAKRAAEILSAPSSETLTGAAEESPGEYDVPRCPACGGEEIVLESVDPVNQWLCDGCGHTWLEEPVSQD
ncbi:MAG TPA: hypothetical protein VNU92_16320 [Edaphobacter sp.]|jgi:hypothetical protein|nr:hypothetical protein [Edaphobacter sp.]